MTQPQTKTETHPPTYTSLSSIYTPSSLPTQSHRYHHLSQQFQNRFKLRPQFYARSPGRMNIIGEHVDYSLYPCVPFALDSEDIVIACCIIPHSTVDNKQQEGAYGSKGNEGSGSKSGNEGGKIVVANMNNEKYAERTYYLNSGEDWVQKYFNTGTTTNNTANNTNTTTTNNTSSNNDSTSTSKKEHHWSLYFLAGMIGVLQYAGIKQPQSVYCLVDGRVPTGSGVSSSSALVVTSALLSQHIHHLTLSKMELCQSCIQSERLVGVMSGGMDQSACVFGVMGCCMMVDFYPGLIVEEIEMNFGGTPAATDSKEGSGTSKEGSSDSKTGSGGVEWVICNTLKVCDKLSSASAQYNKRVSECRYAALLLLHKLGLHHSHSTNDILREIPMKQLTLRHVQEALFREGRLEGDKISQLEQMIQLVEECLKKEVYTLDEISKELQMSKEELEIRVLDGMIVEGEEYWLYQRVVHVLTESIRVQKLLALFRQSTTSTTTTTTNTNTTANSKEIYKEIGELLNQSMYSCTYNYDCSCEELNQLSNLAMYSNYYYLFIRKYGAYGSRLTGAGWGGCIVALIDENKYDQFREGLVREYYRPRGLDVGEGDIFGSRAGMGACIYEPLSGHIEME